MQQAHLALLRHRIPRGPRHRHPIPTGRKDAEHATRLYLDCTNFQTAGVKQLRARGRRIEPSPTTGIDKPNWCSIIYDNAVIETPETFANRRGRLERISRLARTLLEIEVPRAFQLISFIYLSEKLYLGEFQVFQVFQWYFSISDFLFVL